MFTPESVGLPDAWPACPRSHCGSTAAVARIDAPYGPIAVACENGHHRSYHDKDGFRRGGRYAGLFSARAVRPDVPPGACERRLEPGARRRAEVLEDAERCMLCGTPPAEHPYRPDLAVRADRDVWTWFQRWRPQVYAQLREAVAIAGQRERVTFGNWRLRIPARLRERVVDELDGSALRSEHLVPLVRLEALAGVLSQRELGFAVNRLLLATCRNCGEGRWRLPHGRDDYVREYVRALHGGDERAARADAAAWRMLLKIAAHAARAAA